MADSLTHYITCDRFLKSGNFSEEFARGMRFGVQGPDPFFFGGGAESFVFGDKLHDVAPKAYFERESDKLSEMSELYKGYYFGVLLHYFEDRIMHQYVGYLCRKYPSPATHGTVEREFDIVLYRAEYGKKIRSFNTKKVYAVDDAIIDVVYSFWSKRTDDKILTREYVAHSLGQAFKLTDILLKANPIIVFVMRQKEKKSGQEGVYSCHFKTGYTTEHMNSDRKEWDSPIASYTLSVTDIVEKGITDFAAEYKKINDCFENKQPYSFNHTETFSCGK